MFTQAVARWTAGGHDSEYTESWSAFQARCLRALEELIRQLGPGKTALVFTSGGPITAICRELLQIPVAHAFRLNWTLANCGIKDIVNGPISYTPDGSALIGPAWGVPNVWLNEGHSFGITAAGGAGWQLAEWIVEGEPGIDLLAVDPRRFGPYTSKRYLVQKNEETYRNVFTVHYPDEERPDARPAKTSPVYEKLTFSNATRPLTSPPVASVRLGAPGLSWTSGSSSSTSSTRPTDESADAICGSSTLNRTSGIITATR